MYKHVKSDLRYLLKLKNCVSEATASRFDNLREYLISPLFLSFCDIPDATYTIDRFLSFDTVTNFRDMPTRCGSVFFFKNIFTPSTVMNAHKDPL